MEEKKSLFDGLSKSYSELLAEGAKNAIHPKDEPPENTDNMVIWIDDADPEDIEELEREGVFDYLEDLE